MVTQGRPSSQVLTTLHTRILLSYVRVFVNDSLCVCVCNRPKPLPAGEEVFCRRVTVRQGSRYDSTVDDPSNPKAVDRGSLLQAVEVGVASQSCKWQNKDTVHRICNSSLQIV